MLLAPTRYVAPATPREEPNCCTCPTARWLDTQHHDGAPHPHTADCAWTARWARLDAVIAAAQQRLLNGGGDV